MVVETAKVHIYSLSDKSRQKEGRHYPVLSFLLALNVRIDGKDIGIGVVSKRLRRHRGVGDGWHFLGWAREVGTVEVMALR